MGYQGPERRVHRVYVTLNSEYHLRGGRCVAVRDREDGLWYVDHPALGRDAHGALRDTPAGRAAVTGPARAGDALRFGDGDAALVTSRVERVERPPRGVVASYRN